MKSKMQQSYESNDVSAQMVIYFSCVPITQFFSWQRTKKQGATNQLVKHLAIRRKTYLKDRSISSVSETVALAI